jgi:hypothetical protein
VLVTFGAFEGGKLDPYGYNEAAARAEATRVAAAGAAARASAPPPPPPPPPIIDYGAAPPPPPVGSSGLVANPYAVPEAIRVREVVPVPVQLPAALNTSLAQATSNWLTAPYVPRAALPPVPFVIPGATPPLFPAAPPAAAAPWTIAGYPGYPVMLAAAGVVGLLLFLHHSKASS